MSTQAAWRVGEEVSCLRAGFDEAGKVETAFSGGAVRVPIQYEKDAAMTIPIYGEVRELLASNDKLKITSSNRKR